MLHIRKQASWVTTNGNIFYSTNPHVRNPATAQLRTTDEAASFEPPETVQQTDTRLAFLCETIDSLGVKSATVLKLPTSEPPASVRLRPLYIPRAEAITVKDAVFKFDISADTLRRYVRLFSIANQAVPGAPLRISAIGLAMVLDGDHAALSRLRDDDRDHPDVARYFTRLGIPRT